MDSADGYPVDSKRSNTSRAGPLPTEEENVINYQNQANLDGDYYDMGKKKYLHIFNHFRFKQTRQFGNKLPTDRVGTHYDVKILEDTFKAIGFDVKTHQDLSHEKIISVVRKLIKQDHSNTSCVALAVLTHGSYDGYLFAEDEPYELKEITKLLETQKLVLIPKLLFLQVSMEIDNVCYQPSVLRRMSSWRSSINRLRRSVTPKILTSCVQGQPPAPDSTPSDAATSSDMACRGHALDKGHQVEVDGIIGNLIHVPTHIDFLVLHSAADGHASFRCNEEGSWMIQTLCDVIKDFHLTHDILQMITIVNRRVAYDRTAYNLKFPSYNNKKQSLEARYTLTKFLKL